MSIAHNRAPAADDGGGMKMPVRISQRLQSARGANMVEYIILVGLVALIALVGFQAFGGGINKKVFEQGGVVRGI